MSIRNIMGLVNTTLPFAWDDSLSVYEMLGKLISKINEVVDEVNLKLPDDFETTFYERFREYTREEMQRVLDSGEFATILDSMILEFSPIKQEIIDARDGEVSVGKKIRAIDSMILEFSPIKQEVIDARDGEVSVGKKIRGIDEQLAQTLIKTNQLELNKATKEQLAQTVIKTNQLELNKATKQQLSEKVDRNHLTIEIEKVNNKINRIVTTPTDDVNAQEIIAARQGKDSLGENLEDIRNNITSYFVNPLKNSDFKQENLQDYGVLFGSMQLSKYVEAIPTSDTVVLTAGGTSSNIGAVLYQKLQDKTPTLDKWYIKARVRSWDVNIYRIYVGFRGVDGLSHGYKGEDEIAIGQWTDVSHIFYPEKEHTLDGEFRASIYASYWSQYDQTGKRIEIDKITAINLTKTFGYGNEPTQEEMDYIMTQFPSGYFHDVANVGAVQKAMTNFFLSKNRKEVIKKPLIALTFDDGFETDYSIAYPLLKQRGITATSYIIGSHVGNRERRMDWEQLKELKINGWDIQCHSYNTPRLADLTSDEDIRQEFILNDQLFTQQKFPTPEHHAYPFGSHNDNVRNIARQFRKTLRRINPVGGAPYNSYDSIDFSNLNARGSDIRDNNIEKLDDLKQDMDVTFENNGVLILFSHEMKHEGAGDYETKVEYYTELIDYAIAKGFKFVTMTEMYNRIIEYQES